MKTKEVACQQSCYIELWQKVRWKAKILNSRFGMPNSPIHDFRMQKSLNHEFGTFKSWFQNPECMILTYKILLIQDFGLNYYFMSKLYKYNPRNSCVHFQIHLELWCGVCVKPKSWIQHFGRLKSWIEDFWTPIYWIQDFEHQNPALRILKHQSLEFRIYSVQDF